MKFNICLVQPPNYIHSQALAELGELIAYGLHDLGHPTTMMVHGIQRDARNIILGCHLAPPGMANSLPPGSIAVNSEQISDPGNPIRETVFAWARHVEMWDYSPRNVAAFAERHVPVKLLRLGWHPGLKRIAVADPQDIDVLFYGSVNDRRREILDAIAADGMNLVTVFGQYGAARDAQIARAKVVLNIHYYESQILEVVRLSYLMNNAKAVVAEVNSDTAVDGDYLPGICAVPRDGVVAACRRLVDDAAARREVEARALATLQRLPQAALLAPLLAAG
ncbi:hypothetical protein IP88_13880 [alpha proteobacterium AAP81b]|nr:hypothetical protein IP88_13880 [alpha proteobacterium AAP81b]